MIVVLDGFALNPGDLTWNGLRKLGEVQIYERTPEEWIVERARDADIILTNNNTPSAATVEKLPQATLHRSAGYRLRCDRRRGGAGAGHHGHERTHLWNRVGGAVHDRAAAGALSACRHTQSGGPGRGLVCRVRTGPSGEHRWSNWRKDDGHDRIRAHWPSGGKIALALEMRVIASTRLSRTLPIGRDLVGSTVDRLMQESDVVTLHCPLDTGNKGIVNASRLSRMKPTAFLLNTSRGPLVVEADLASALNERWLAGAAGCVKLEPPHAPIRFFRLETASLHRSIAWATKEAGTAC